MTQYPYENLSDTEFEELVIRICKEVLGIGCKTFSVGKDGAKDSWFNGKAEKFPSSAESWTGNFNIQAKHTNRYNASCSDNDFSVNQTSVLNKEISRLKEIKADTPFTNYILFTNRKLSGGAHPEIVTMLREGLDITNVEIIGREQIDTYLTDFPDIVNQFGLYRFTAPLRFNEKDLKDVILFFEKKRLSLAREAKEIVTSFAMLDKDEKNRINNLSEEYFKFIKQHSLQYFADIDIFLKDPKNETYTNMYLNTVSDLQEVILIERNRFNEFEHIIKHLIDYLVQNNSDELYDVRRIVRVFVHFMYFNCDIGVTA